MSASISAPEGTRSVTLKISTQSADAEIFVIDHRLQMVARGLESLTTEQVPGVYKVKVQSGRDLREETVLLVKDEVIAWDMRQVASSAPLEYAAHTHEYQTDGAADRSRRVDLRQGTGGSLFVMVRNWSSRDPTHVVRQSNHPCAGLSLAAWNQSWHYDLTQLAIEDADKDAWCAVNIEVDPGIYLLRADLGKESILECAVAVSPGWQSQLFLLSQPRSRDADKPGRDREVGFRQLLNTTILMGRNGFDPRDQQLHAAETARLALADDRPFGTEELNNLLFRKFQNPMLGIMGAHMLLLGREDQDRRKAEGQRRERVARERAPNDRSTNVQATIARPAARFDQGLFDEVVDNLRGLVGNAHPDVEALALQHSQPQRRPTKAIDGPPMLRRSWSLLVEGSTDRPELVPVDLWRRIAMRTATSPFLSWMSSTEGAVQTSAFLDELRAHINTGPRTIAEGAERSATARADMRSFAPEPRNLAKTATDLDIPRAAVEWLIKE